jgi:amino-acid N-acetyltransferase
MIRRANIKDVPGIHELVTRHAERGAMLFRSLADLYEKVRQFLVWQEQGEVLGCCALEIVWRDLAEVKSLAVAESAQGRGIGRKLVEATEAEARELGLDRLFALTREQDFFLRMDFEIVPKAALPHKVWNDCIKCPVLHDCDEVAVCKVLTDTGREQMAEAIARAGKAGPLPDPTGHSPFNVLHG